MPRLERFLLGGEPDSDFTFHIKWLLDRLVIVEIDIIIAILHKVILIVLLAEVVAVVTVAAVVIVMPSSRRPRSVLIYRFWIVVVLPAQIPTPI